MIRVICLWLASGPGHPPRIPAETWGRGEGLFASRDSILIFVSLLMQGAKMSAIVFRDLLLGFIVSWAMQLGNSSNILGGNVTECGAQFLKASFPWRLVTSVPDVISLFTQGVHSMISIPVLLQRLYAVPRSSNAHRRKSDAQCGSKSAVPFYLPHSLHTFPFRRDLALGLISSIMTRSAFFKATSLLSFSLHLNITPLQGLL